MPPVLSRSNGIVDREKYSARPFRSVTTFTALGLSTSCGGHGVLMVETMTLGSFIGPSSASRCSGRASGSSPWIFTYTSAAMRCATSYTRSVPLRCLSEVICAFHPRACASCKTSSESVAMSTSRNSGDFFAASYTRAIICCPAISRSTLRGSRVEARRAGMMAMAEKESGIRSTALPLPQLLQLLRLLFHALHQLALHLFQLAGHGGVAQPDDLCCQDSRVRRARLANRCGGHGDACWHLYDGQQ